EETLAAGRYFRDILAKEGVQRGKIAVIGHSTGCQDIIQLLTRMSPEDTADVRAIFAAAILLAPVSDREWISMVVPEETLQMSLVTAKTMIENGQGEKIMAGVPPKEMGMSVPTTARRWASLAGSLKEFPDGEDFFSSDLGEEEL